MRLDGDEALRPTSLLAPSPGRARDPTTTSPDQRCARGRKVLWAEQGPLWRSAGREQQLGEPWPDPWGWNQRRLSSASDGPHWTSRETALQPGAFDIYLGPRQRRAGRRSCPASARLLSQLRFQERVAAPGPGDAWRSKLPTDAADRGGAAGPASRVAGMAAVRGMAAGSRRRRSRRAELGSCVARAQIAGVGDGAARPPRTQTYPGGECIAKASVVPAETTAGTISAAIILVWPRDLAESAGALLALGATAEAANILRYLDYATQRRRPLVAEPVAGRQGVLGRGAARRDGVPGIAGNRAFDLRRARRHRHVREMVQRALSWVASQRPLDRTGSLGRECRLQCLYAWRLRRCAGLRRPPSARAREELRSGNRGLLEQPHRGVWTSARDTTLAWTAASPRTTFVVCRRRSPPAPRASDTCCRSRICLVDPRLAADEQISTDFVQLVRLGLREANDPLVVDSLKVV